MKNIHENKPDFKICKICNSKFKRQGDLNRHYKVHFPKLYICIYCDKQFTFNCNLLRHIRTLHSK